MWNHLADYWTPFSFDRTSPQLLFLRETIQPLLEVDTL